MGSYALQFCFSVNAAAEEDSYVSAEEVYASSFLIADSLILSKGTKRQ